MADRMRWVTKVFDCADLANNVHGIKKNRKLGIDGETILLLKFRLNIKHATIEQRLFNILTNNGRRRGDLVAR